MNDLQVKVYVVLKFVQKDRLKPVCQNFTSYMVKNLVFWVLEETPMRDLTPETLVDRILTAFRHLKQFLENKFLPCYIIPERNLFHGRMNERDCVLLLGEVDKIIDEGCGFLLKHHKLSLSMQLTFSYPDIARGYEQWLVEIEDVFIMIDGNEAFTDLLLKVYTGQIDFVEGFQQLLFNTEGGLASFIAQIVRLWQLLGLDIGSILENTELSDFNSLLLNRITDALS